MLVLLCLDLLKWANQTPQLQTASYMCLNVHAICRVHISYVSLRMILVKSIFYEFSGSYPDILFRNGWQIARLAVHVDVTTWKRCPYHWSFVRISTSHRWIRSQRSIHRINISFGINHNELLSQWSSWPLLRRRGAHVMPQWPKHHTGTVCFLS